MTNPTVLNFETDVNGKNAYAPKFAVTNYSATLAASTEQKLPAVPGTYKQWVAVFSPAAGMNFFAAVNDTAELPAGATFASTTSQQNCSARWVEADDVISVISEEGGNIGVSLYAVS